MIEEDSRRGLYDAKLLGVWRYELFSYLSRSIFWTLSRTCRCVNIWVLFGFVFVLLRLLCISLIFSRSCWFSPSILALILAFCYSLAQLSWAKRSIEDFLWANTGKFRWRCSCVSDPLRTDSLWISGSSLIGTTRLESADLDEGDFDVVWGSWEMRESPIFGRFQLRFLRTVSPQFLLKLTLEILVPDDANDLASLLRTLSSSLYLTALRSISSNLFFN